MAHNAILQFNDPSHNQQSVSVNAYLNPLCIIGLRRVRWIVALTWIHHQSETSRHFLAHSWNITVVVTLKFGKGFRFASPNII
jgi:hypothetical protein